MPFRVKFHVKILNRFPIISQVIQTGCLMGLGDVLAQKVVEKKNNLNYVRIAQFAGVGTFFVGPTLAVWYRTLERRIGSKTTIQIVKKVALDQLIFAPIFIILVMTVVFTVQSCPFDETKKKISESYPNILVNNYKVWPAVQFLNFYFIPVQYQVTIVQIVAILWNTYLSWTMNKK